MSAYEYIRLKFDRNDLEEMNRFGSVGWRVVSVIVEEGYALVALLERELPSPVKDQ